MSPTSVSSDDPATAALQGNNPLVLLGLLLAGMASSSCDCITCQCNDCISVVCHCVCVCVCVCVRVCVMCVCDVRVCVMSEFKIMNLLSMAIGAGQNPFYVAVLKLLEKSVITRD